MIHLALIDVTNKQILFPETCEPGDYADTRYWMLDLQAFLNARDIGGEWKAYRGDTDYAFLPSTAEEAAQAASATDVSGVDATVSS
jgi:hypothetical protein